MEAAARPDAPVEIARFDEPLPAPARHRDGVALAPVPQRQSHVPRGERLVGTLVVQVRGCIERRRGERERVDDGHDDDRQREHDHGGEQNGRHPCLSKRLVHCLPLSPRTDHCDHGGQDNASQAPN